MKDLKKIQEFFSESIDEAKVDYDFSERELIRVLRQLKRGASGEIEMINAFKKALGRDITKDELFSEAIAENKILKQAKLSSAEYQKVKKLKDFNKDNYKWNPSEGLYIKLNEATPADDGIAAAGGGTPADQGRAADKTDGLTTKAMNKILMNVIKDLKEGEPGLWDNIRAKKARGEKPSSKNSKAYKSAVAAGKRINKEK